MNSNRTLILCLLMFSSLGLFAQEFGFGPGLSYLLVNPDAQSSSMGGFGIANSKSANAIFNNFSLVPNLNNKATVDVSFLPSDTNISGRVLSVAGFLKIKNNHALGLSVRRANYDFIKFSDLNGNCTSSGPSFDYEFSAAYGFLIGQHFSFGLRAKYLYSNINTGSQISGNEIISGKSIAADLSLSYHKVTTPNKDKLIIGLIAENIGTRISYTRSPFLRDIKLPLNFGIAASYKKHLSHTLNTLFSIGYENQFEEFAIFSPRWSIGNELTFNDTLSLRLGYENHKANSIREDLIFLGAGLQIKSVSIQFAYLINPNVMRNFMDDHSRMNLALNF